MKRLITGILAVVILITCGTTFKVGSQLDLSKRKFKVALIVDGMGDDENITINLMNIYIRDAIGEKEDIEIVNAKTGDWEYLVRIHILKPKYRTGGVSEMNVIVVDYFQREGAITGLVDMHYNAEVTKKIYPNQQVVLYPNIQEVMMVSDKDLKNTAEVLFLILDSGFLQTDRDRIKKYPKTEEGWLKYLENLK